MVRAVFDTGGTRLGMGSEREGGFISGRDGWEGTGWGFCVFSGGCVEQVLRIRYGMVVHQAVCG